MEILIRGTPPTKNNYILHCSCGTRVKIAKEELKYGTQYNETYYWWICPICNKMNSLTEDELDKFKVID